MSKAAFQSHVLFAHFGHFILVLAFTSSIFMQYLKKRLIENSYFILPTLKTPDVNKQNHWRRKTLF